MFMSLSFGEIVLKLLEKLTRLLKFDISIPSNSFINLVSEQDSIVGKAGGLYGDVFPIELF